MKIAYLSSQATLPAAVNRRSDAFEHDQMMTCLRSAFQPHGARIDDIAWDNPAALWSSFDAAIIGTAWDYCDRQEEFLGRLEAISAATRLYNSTAMAKWNSHKTYLRELGAKGIALVPTVWCDQASEDAVSSAFDKLYTDDLVLKRQVGASADGQHRIRRGEPIPSMPEPMMAQPFLSAILTEGEYSFIFVDGALSHTLIKKPAADDYRIQTLFGGQEVGITAAPKDVSAAARVLSALDETPLYARVDMLRDDNGALCLMELELIEPFLYPLQGPELGHRLYAALKKRL